MLVLSFSEPTLGQPPFVPVLEWLEEAGELYLVVRLRIQNYLALFADGLYLAAFASSLRIAATGTLIALLIGFPIALGMARCPPRVRPFLLLAIMLPFWTSFLIRVYAWMGILKDDGILNGLLLALGVIDRPLRILDTEAAVVIGIVYSYLPFMILPIFANLERHDPALLEAAVDLGCRPLKAFGGSPCPWRAPAFSPAVFWSSSPRWASSSSPIFWAALTP